MAELKLGSDLTNAIKKLITNSNDINDINNNLKSLSNITVDKLWENPSTNATFTAQTINVNVASYDFCILTYDMFRGGDGLLTDMGTKVLEIGKDNPITDTFRYATNLYYGYRGVRLNPTNLIFKDAQNNVKNTDNSWYVPVKLYGIRIGKRTNITPQNVIINNKTLSQAIRDELPNVANVIKRVDSKGWTVIDDPAKPYIEYHKRGTVNLSLNKGISWKVMVLSTLPDGVSSSDPNIYGSGFVESWDSALIAPCCISGNNVQTTACWLYGGNGWNSTHKWSFSITKLRT